MMIEGYLVRNFLNFLIFSFFFLDFPWGGGGGVPERGEQEECYVSVPDFFPTSVKSPYWEIFPRFPFFFPAFFFKKMRKIRKESLRY